MTRTKIKHMSALLAAATLTAVASAGVKPAEAAIVIESVTPATAYSNFINGGPAPTTNLGSRLINFNGESSPTTFSSGKNREVSLSGGGIVSGNLSGQYAAPAADADGDQALGNDRDDTDYLSVGGTNEPGPVTFKFKYPIISTFGFLWGSIDDYNTINFFKKGALLASFTGLDILKPANGDQGATGTAFVNFKGNDVNNPENDYFDTVELLSSQAAFEIDDVRYEEVPTPALLPGLIGIGVAALRKRKQAGETQEA